MGVMIIDLSEIDEGESILEGEEPASILELDDVANTTVDGPVQYRLAVSLVGDELVILGETKVPISFTCVRCTELFSTIVGEKQFSRAIEVNQTMESVDLTGDIRESIILAFPMNPLCEQGCKGLCASCGGNLNETRCECAPTPPPANSWSALGELDIS